MAIVVYRCDTCKREVELIRNLRGLETPNRCVITHSCRGKLIQKDLLEDFSRASIPQEVEGLDDWIPRRVLYNHDQTIENTVWIITHSLGTFPSISVFVDRPTLENPNNREEVTPDDVQILDKNTLLLRFDRPRSGIAQLVARSSDPQLFEPSSALSTTGETFTQITSSLRMVIATRIKSVWSDTAVGVALDYSSSTGNVVSSLQTAANGASSLTAWNNASKVVIRGKVYQVREMNGSSTGISTGSIINGMTFRFKGFDFNRDSIYEYVVDETDVTVGSPAVTTISPGDIYILLSSYPYETADKVLDKMIDVTSVTLSDNPRAFFYDSGEMFASDSVVQSVFPSIRVL